ncbi:hypothetical protein [Pedobacter rhodius]|uniref:Uncharacterized protein n=1 Tax=Pedobacter rhodius TaxID=3004098 RepID=A0ABT4KTW7_9SPHI|nr:hypothetical protein [Pedobacter sp. SJ11]MCZ4222357.1 hypothetical protein [Pedobacter sp. SJ11]
MNVKIVNLFAFAILLTSFSLKAQNVEENIRMVKPFKADGLSNEWEEPLNQYNDATKLAFALANDDTNLYIIIESLDPQTTFSVLRGGITLNINTQGKKKDGIKLIFPLIERPPMLKDGEMPEGKDGAPPQWQEDRSGEQPVMKSIKIFGFKNIKDGNLPVVNEEGIETGMGIRPNKDLTYELSIPLAQLEVSLDMKTPLVYNIKINQPNRPDFKKGGDRPEGEGRPGSRGGMGGGGMGGGRGGMERSVGKMGGGSGGRPPGAGMDGPENRKSDFWIKYKLVKA